MNQKMRIYPPVIVTILVALALMAAAVATVSKEAEQAATDTQLPLAVSTTLAQAAPVVIPEAAPEPEPVAADTSAIYSRDLDSEDSQMLLKIAMAEAEGETVEGKALVMLVVLNRVWSEAFPDTVEEVIFQKNQFSPMAKGGRYWTTEPDDGCNEALELVMSGWDESQGALYFESTGADGWHSRNLEFLFELGCHKFYR